MDQLAAVVRTSPSLRMCNARNNSRARVTRFCVKDPSTPAASDLNYCDYRMIRPCREMHARACLDLIWLGLCNLWPIQARHSRASYDVSSRSRTVYSHPAARW
jgi:hypothetical protein